MPVNELLLIVVVVTVAVTVLYSLRPVVAVAVVVVVIFGRSASAAGALSANSTPGEYPVPVSEENMVHSSVSLANVSAMQPGVISHVS